MWRTVTSALLITLACLLAPLSATAVWASRQISDTARYVETVAPLANDPAVQRTIADAVSREILAVIDRRGITTENLQSFVRDQVGDAVASAQFPAGWRQANEAAHGQLVSLLAGEQGGALSAESDTVMLNLAPIIALVKERLVAGGFSLAERIPVVDRSIVLVQSHRVPEAQGLYRLLNTLGLSRVTSVSGGRGTLPAATCRKSPPSSSGVGVVAIAPPVPRSASPALRSPEQTLTGRRRFRHRSVP